LFFVFQIGIFH